jgi:CDP-4-dehydro-6-deoxyglucose reductase
MLPQWQTGVVRRIESINTATRSFFIELPEVERFDFKPGQFVTLDLPIHEQRNRRWRSYSIASAPDGGNIIELLIVLLEGGSGTTYLFNEIKEGSTLTLRGPHGVFVLPQDLTDDLFLICTGTGVAPFRSMAAWLAANPHPHAAVHLIFGCRNQSELLYRDELAGYASIIPGFQYHPTLSREEWEGRRGYVHPIYEELCAGNQPAQFMLCGWKAMVDEAKARILAMGYDKKRVHLELYG